MYNKVGINTRLQGKIYSGITLLHKYTADQVVNATQKHQPPRYQWCRDDGYRNHMYNTPHCATAGSYYNSNSTDIAYFSLIFIPSRGKDGNAHLGAMLHFFPMWMSIVPHLLANESPT
jgi:hypothetical protein